MPTGPKIYARKIVVKIEHNKIRRKPRGPQIEQNTGELQNLRGGETFKEERQVINLISEDGIYRKRWTV